MPERSARGLLDTNVIIDLPLVDVEHLPVDAAISTVTLAELSAGPLATDDPVERALRQLRLQRAEAAFAPLPFDTECARRYASVFAAVTAAGRRPRRRSADLLIASVALAHGLPLFTANPGDFAGLEDLVAVVPVPRRPA